MSDVEEKGQAGSILSWTFLPWPWPVARPVTLFTKPLTGSSMTLVALPSGRIRIDVFGPDPAGPRLSVLTCPISALERPFVFLGISWRLPDYLFVVLNKVVIASSIKPETVPSEYKIPMRNTAQPVRHDFSTENSVALTKRAECLVRAPARASRVHGDRNYVFSQLQNEARQVHDLLDAISRGALHHAAGLTARLRAIVADSLPMPLLQLAAAYEDAPLIVYTDADPRHQVDFERLGIPPATYHLDQSMEPHPNGIHNNPIDLDVWLGLFGASVETLRFTHLQAIKSIGNTAGAHIDRDVHPLVAHLRTLNSLMNNGTEYDLLTDYVVRTSSAVLKLSEELLRRLS